MKTKTKSKTEPEKSDLYRFVEMCYRSRGKTVWRDLNPALAQTLLAGIRLHMASHEGDIHKINVDFSGDFWFYGQQEHKGEHFYAAAVQAGNTPVCLSFEAWAGRQPYLWAKDSPRGQRLFVGDSFVWQGIAVRVTSIKKEYLVAVGAQGEKGRTFKISADQLAAARKAYDAERRKWEKEVAAVQDFDGLDLVGEKVRDAFSKMRHWDIESLRKTFSAKRAALEKVLGKEPATVQAARLAAKFQRLLPLWRLGEDVRLPVGEEFPVALRIKGEKVQASNGNSVPLAAVRAVLPIMDQYRARQAASSPNVKQYQNATLHQHPVQFSPDGVKVGCTWLSWAEVDSILPELR